jgi:hypothetical protein
MDTVVIERRMNKVSIRWISHDSIEIDNAIMVVPTKGAPKATANVYPSDFQR